MVIDKETERLIDRAIEDQVETMMPWEYEAFLEADKNNVEEGGSEDGML